MNKIKTLLSKIKGLLLLSFIINCITTGCAWLYYQYYNFNINVGLLKKILFDIPIILAGLLLGLLLFYINSTHKKYYINQFPIEKKKLYKNSMLIFGALVGVGLLSAVIPLRYFFAVEIIISDFLLIVFDWIAEIINYFFHIRLQLDKLLHVASLKSALLFLETYFFCELYRANKIINKNIKDNDSIM